MKILRLYRVFINRFEVGVDLRLGTNLFGGHLTLRELDIKLDIHDTLVSLDLTQSCQWGYNTHEQVLSFEGRLHMARGCQLNFLATSICPFFFC